MKILTENSSVPYLISSVGREILSSGIEPDLSFRMARRIKYALKRVGIEECQKELLRLIIIKTLKSFKSDYKKRYVSYLKLKLSEKPLIILISGVNGVGKSTLAIELAYRFNISQIVSTDIIRESMRFFYDKKKDAAIFKSSHNAWELIGEKNKRNILKGYKKHTDSVIPGVTWVLNRTSNRKKDMIIEGVHLLPSQLKKFLGKDNIYFFTIIAKTEKEHKNKFYLRAEQLHGSSIERFFKHFDQIRLIQDYIIEDSKKYNIPVFDNDNMEDTLNSISAHVLLAA